MCTKKFMLIFILFILTHYRTFRGAKKEYAVEGNYIIINHVY